MKQPTRKTNSPVAATEEAEHRIQQLGESLIANVFRVGRIVRVHDLSNRAAVRGLAELMRVVHELIQMEGRVTISVATDLLLVNDVRVIVDPHAMGPLIYVLDAMSAKNVEQIEFQSPVSDEHVGLFLRLLFEETDEDDSFGEFIRKVEAAGIEHIELTEKIERQQQLVDTFIESRDLTEASNKAYTRALQFLAEVVRAIGQRRPVQMRKAKRLTEQMVTIIQEDESVMIGLSSLKDYDEYTFAHSVNVSVLSMLLADRAGLSKHDVSEIGVAGLLHDIGKTKVPHEIVNKPGALEPDEWEQMRRHTTLGVREVAKSTALRTSPDALFVALQHHRHFAGGGYPTKPGDWSLALASRIVTIADHYDAMTTPRVYRESTLTPDKVIRFLIENSGQIFDPVLVKVFVRAMGIYPVGTVVKLDSGDYAVVVRQNEPIQMLHRPVVSMLGGGVEDAPEIDLSEKVEGGNGFARTIAEAVYDPEAEAKKTGLFVTS